MIDQGGGIVLDVLKGYGGPGAVILCLLYVVWVLAGRNDALQKELKDVLKGAADLAKNDAVVLANFTTASEARNRLSDASVRSQELLTAGVQEMRTESQRSFQRLNEDLARRWGQQ